MSWVERIRGYIEVKLFRRFIISCSALAAAASGLIASAVAATTSFIDQGPGRIVPMYGVAIPIDPPVVKYGPPPTATPLPISPGGPSFGIPDFNWNSAWSPPWSSGGPSGIHFTAPSFSHWFPAFPKLMGIAASDVLATLATIAYLSLLLAAVCGWTLRGGAWYLKNKNKK